MSYTYEALSPDGHSGMAFEIFTKIKTKIPTNVSQLTNDSGYTTNTGTVTSVKIAATDPIAVSSSSAITTSGTRTLSHKDSGVTAGTYRSVTVDAKGHVTAGTNPTTLSGYDITDAKIANGTITLGSNTITPLTQHQDISGKVDKTGDTMTGALTLYKEGTTENNYSTQLIFKNKDTTTGKTSTGYFRVYEGGENGANFTISPGGNMFIGSGESAINHYGLYKHSTTENFYATADSVMFLQAAGGTIAKRKGLIINNTAHEILPCAADVATNNIGSIGNSTYKWASVYATNLYGSLTGDISGGTGLTSTQVTAALGFTPYDSTNPSGYTSNTGTITSVKTTAGAHTTINVSSGAVSFKVPTKTSHLTNDSGFLTSYTETDPTVPSWAKASSKPSYNFSEIGSKPTTISGYGITDAKISNGTITLGSNTITPLTSFTETDPTVPSWAKASSKPTYSWSEITSKPLVSETQSSLESVAITETASRQYAVNYDSNGKLSVNVPWSNTNTAIRIYRQTTGYNKDYPIIVARTQASGIGTAGSNGSYTAVYGVMGDDTTKIPTINPLSGEIKAVKFTGDISSSTGLTSAQVTTALGFTPGTSNLTLGTSSTTALKGDAKYAGASTAGGAATSAEKLTNTSKIGDTNKPVYFTANGVPSAISYTINKSVPSDAVFTDHYAWSDITSKPTTLSGYGITDALPLSGGTLTGWLAFAGSDINLKTSGASSNDSSDIAWWYGNGNEKARIWTDNTYTTKKGLNYRVYKEDGTALYSGRLATLDDVQSCTISTGTNVGQIKVTPSSGSAYNVDVKGFGADQRLEALYTCGSSAALPGSNFSGNGRRGYLFIVFNSKTPSSSNRAVACIPMITGTVYYVPFVVGTSFKSARFELQTATGGGNGIVISFLSISDSNFGVEAIWG